MEHDWIDITTMDDLAQGVHREIGFSGRQRTRKQILVGDFASGKFVVLFPDGEDSWRYDPPLDVLLSPIP